MPHTRRTRGTRGKNRRKVNRKLAPEWDCPSISRAECASDKYSAQEQEDSKPLGDKSLPWGDILYFTTDDQALAGHVAWAVKPAMDAFPDETYSMLSWACIDNDFMTAPASTRFHLSQPGGLACHSTSVAQQAIEMMKADENADIRESLGENWEAITATVALWHDACKISFYDSLDRPGKTGGKYGVTPDRKDDKRHGELSVDLVRLRYGDKLPEEAYEAIELHMGEWDYRRYAPDWLVKKIDEIDQDEKTRFDGMSEEEVEERKAKDKKYLQMKAELDDFASYMEDRFEKNKFAKLIHEADKKSTDMGR